MNINLGKYLKIKSENRMFVNMIPVLCRACGIDRMKNAADKDPWANFCKDCRNSMYDPGYPAGAMDSHAVVKGGQDEHEEEDTDNFEGLFDDWEIIDNEFELMPEGPKCECGAEKAGTPWHARWCDLHEEVF